MKSTLIKSSLFNGLLSLTILAGCGTGAEQKVEESTTLPKTEAVSEPIATAKEQYYINTVDNQKLAEISYSENQIAVSTTSEQFFGILKRADKRKYYDQNDQMKYAVKYSDGGFKLRDQNEALLWKIKIDDKIKIANNEEMEEAYKISRSDESKIKLKKDEVEVDAIRVSADSPFTTVKDKYSVHNFGNSLALGILMMDEIPDQQKFMICAELLKLQK